jgi:phenylalanyl-tRNA synthetase beta chain
VLSGAVDVVTGDIAPIVLDLTQHDVERLLGPGFEEDLITTTLHRLGMTIEGRSPMRVTVPTYRPDITRPVDLVEEVARIHGYDRFGATTPTGPVGGLTPQQVRVRRLREVLIGAGLDQAINLPFVGTDDLHRLGMELDEEGLLTVRNPLREEESKLRPTLLPGLLNDLRHNLSYGASSVAMFETGSVFHTDPAPWDPRLPDQPERVAWAVCGEMGLQILGMTSTRADATASLGLWKLLADTLGIESDLTAAVAPGFHPARTAAVTVGGRRIGHVGELSPLAARAFELPGRVAIAELELTPLVEPVEPRRAQSPPLFPHVDFDLSFQVSADLPAVDLVRVTTAAAGELVEWCRVFDEFKDPSLGEGRKALALRYRLRSAQRTLTSDDISRVRSDMIAAASTVGAEHRGA